MNISPLGGLVDSFSTILFYHKPRGDILFLQQKNAVFMRLTAFCKRLIKYHNKKGDPELTGNAVNRMRENRPHGEVEQSTTQYKIRKGV